MDAVVKPWPKATLSDHVRAVPEPPGERPSREAAEAAVRTLIAYAVPGSDAVKRAKRDPSVGVQYLVDGSAVFSRVAFIAHNAPHPAAAKLWMDYILSKAGQQHMQIAELFPIRDDIAGVQSIYGPLPAPAGSNHSLATACILASRSSTKLSRSASGIMGTLGDPNSSLP